MSTFIEHPLTVEDLEHNHALAAQMHSSCPVDPSHQTKIMAQHLQATRREPCKFLGVQCLCIPCQMAYDVEHVQLSL